MKMIDLRSDTVTKPSQEMLLAMCKAEVGDDVFGEDPTVNALEQKVSKLFGKEAGVFVPSGTMSNQLGILVLTQTGEEVIIHETGHIINYEGATAAWISNVQLRPIFGKEGKIWPQEIKAAIRPKNDWDPHTSVIALENTTNKGGGTAYSRDELLAIKQLADEQGLLIHLDGARIWNAITATGIEPEFFGSIAETISVCFSKGLGAPVGSMLLGSSTRMKKARRFRKVLGGGMRQIGLFAAAANFGMEHIWPLLEADHRRAKELAEVISKRDDMEIDPASVQSNIVIFELKNQMAADFLKEMDVKGIRMVAFGPKKIRAVYHYQIDDELQKEILNVFGK